MYQQTLSSKESASDGRTIAKSRQPGPAVGSKKSLQLINEEEEKQNIQNFLDDDIEQIDNILSQADAVADILTER